MQVLLQAVLITKLCSCGTEPIQNAHKTELLSLKIAQINAEKAFETVPLQLEKNNIVKEFEPAQTLENRNESKADRDTLKYDANEGIAWANTYKYFWVMYDIKKIRPSYAPPESTFVLTGVTSFISRPNGQACTLFVYDKHFNLKHRTTYTLPNRNQRVWVEIQIPSLPLYDTFTVVLYLPTAGNRNLPCIETTQPDSMGGVIDNNTWYRLIDADLNIRAVGHFERIHDGSLYEIGFPSWPYIIAQSESLNFNIYNFGNYDEESVPTTIIYGDKTETHNLSIIRKSYGTIPVQITPRSEGLFRVHGYTHLLGDVVPSNDTFPDYYLYFFPKYSSEDYALDFEVLRYFPPPGWTVYDLDGDGKTWAWYTGRTFSHSGWYFGGSEYNPGGNNDWLVSPAIEVFDTCNNAVGFWARSISVGFPEHLIVYSMASQNPADTIEKILDVNSLPASWTRYTFSLDKYRGQTVYLGLRNASVDKFYLLVDDFFLRRVPLSSTQIISEEFEEILTPPGWAVTDDLWRGGTNEDAGVPDNGTGNLYFFNSSASVGHFSELLSSLAKFTTAGLPYVSYQFNYFNRDGNDSLQIYYRNGEGAPWTLHQTLVATGSSNWQSVNGDTIFLDPGKGTYCFQFKLVGYSDGGTSNIAIDNFYANYYPDNSAPTISNFEWWEVNPTSIIVRMDIVDYNGILKDTLYYRVEGLKDFTGITHSLIDGTKYYYEIPRNESGPCTYSVYVSAYDALNNRARYPEDSTQFESFTLTGVDAEKIRAFSVSVKSSFKRKGGMELSYTLPKRSDIEISIYTIAGQRIATVEKGTKEPGYYSIRWNGETDSGELPGSGVFILRAATPEKTITKKIIIAK